MALFPKDDILPEEEAAQRRAWTQETGTRKLVIGFVAILVIWLVGGRLWDIYLLRQKWPLLSPDEAGVTVVGTLDKRGDYDRNMFRVIQSEGASRAEVTNFGWESIFNGRHGKLATDETGNLIRSAIQLDSETGYAMLVPFLRAGIRSEMGDPHAFDGISEDYPVTTTLATTKNGEKQKKGTVRQEKLQDLLDYFAHEGHLSKNGEVNDTAEGGSGSEHSVEHGLAIPGSVLIHACPVVLITSDFAGAWVEEHPAGVIGTKTYSIWLKMTPEGRSRFYQWTRDHARESMIIVLNQQVIAHGRVALTMDVDRWELTNVKDEEAAQLLVNYINKHHG